MSIKNPVAPSSCGIYVRGAVHSTKSSACLRFRWFKAIENFPRLQFPEEFNKMGNFWEEYTEARLKQAGTQYIREREVDIELEGIRIRGFIDFDLPQEDKIIECKAISSSNRRLNIIRKGKPDQAHILQTVMYLIATGRHLAELRYGYIHYKSEGCQEFVHPESEGQSRTFTISISNEGRIEVDGQDYLPLSQLIAYVEEHQKQVADRTALPSRPFIDPLNPWHNACTHCPMRAVCEANEETEILGGTQDLQELADKAIKAAEDYRPSPAKIYTPKPRAKRQSRRKP